MRILIPLALVLTACGNGSASDDPTAAEDLSAGVTQNDLDELRSDIDTARVEMEAQVEDARIELEAQVQEAQDEAEQARMEAEDLRSELEM